MSATCEFHCFADRLTKVFTDLHFTVRVQNDLTHDGLVRCMKIESMRDHRRHNCFVCCILSHGSIGVIYGTDGKTVPIKDLTDYFKAASCPSLSGKPKMFFVQACQGTEKQSAHPSMCFHFIWFLAVSIGDVLAVFLQLHCVPKNVHLFIFSNNSVKN